jgi:large subunit ribosomal protein L9
VAEESHRRCAVKVILLKEVQGLGKPMDTVNVAPGFCRNYLLPKGIAVVASAKSVKQVEHSRKMVEARLAKERKQAMELKEKLEGISCKVAREAGEGDKLFGSVTNRDIAVALAEEGFNDIDHRQISLEAPIRHLGIFYADVKLAPDVTAKVKVWVVAK